MSTHLVAGAARRTIPEQILMNERCNLLASNDTSSCANAVQAQYAKERMRSPFFRGMKVVAWDDQGCFDGISRVHSVALARAIRRERNGMYRSDALSLIHI